MTSELDRRMFCYTVPVNDTGRVFDLTSDPVHVSAGSMPDEVQFWAEFTEGAPASARSFRLFGDGQPLPYGARWIGTCPGARAVLHLYELTEETPSR